MNIIRAKYPPARPLQQLTFDRNKQYVDVCPYCLNELKRQTNQCQVCDQKLIWDKKSG
jgi:hypothetical protein